MTHPGQQARHDHGNVDRITPVERAVIDDFKQWLADGMPAEEVSTGDAICTRCCIVFRERPRPYSRKETYRCPVCRMCFIAGKTRVLSSDGIASDPVQCSIAIGQQVRPPWRRLKISNAGSGAATPSPGNPCADGNHFCHEVDSMHGDGNVRSKRRPKLSTAVRERF